MAAFRTEIIVLTFLLLPVTFVHGAQPPEPKADGRKLKTDLYGDPLPPGALVRMGTIRFRQPYPRVVFSADGKSLTSAGADNTVRTWDVATGKCLRTKSLEDSPDLDLSAVSLSPDGKALLLWKYSRKSMVVYDIVSGKKLSSIIERSEGQPHRAAVSPGGKFVAAYIGGGNAQTIRLWDVAGGTERILLEDRRHHEHLEFSPDGKFLAVAGSYGLRLWDVVTTKLLHHLNIEADCVTFSLDSKTMASANRDRTVKLWDVATGKEQATLQTKPVHDIQCLAFSPNGKLLAAGGQRSVRIWDVAAGKVVRQLPERMVYELAFAPDEKVLAVSGGSNIRLWDLVKGNRLLFREGHNYDADSITPSPNGKVLASTSYSDGTLCLWDVASGKLLHQPSGADVAGRAASFSADGKLLASGGHDGFMHLWEAATGKERRSIRIEPVHPEDWPPYIDAVRLSPDGKRVAAVTRFDRGTQIRVWNAATGELLSTRGFAGDGFEVFTPDGKGITIRVPEGLAIQDIVTGKNFVIFSGVVDEAPIAFSPDGKLVAFPLRSAVVQGAGKAAGVVQPAGERTAIGVADAATGKEILRFQTGEVYNLAFSTDGRLLATSDHNIVRIWELASGKEIYRRSRHKALLGVPAQAAFTAVAVLPGNRALATGLMDGTILIWDLNEKRTAAGEQAPPALDSCWADLAGDDARKAYRAIHSMERFPVQTITYLNEHLRPAAKIDPALIKQLIADLDSEEIAVRRKAGKELEKQGPEVEPVFREVLVGNPSPEVRKRLDAFLARSPLPLQSGDALRQLRAVAVLEHIDNPESRLLLKKLATGAVEAGLTRDAKAALERLAPK